MAISKEEAKKELKKMHDEEMVSSQLRSTLSEEEKVDRGRRVKPLPNLSQLDGERESW